MLSREAQLRVAETEGGAASAILPPAVACLTDRKALTGPSHFALKWPGPFPLGSTAPGPPHQK